MTLNKSAAKTSYDPLAVAATFDPANWCKASDDNGTGCVEVNIEPGRVGLRDSTQPDKGTFMFTHHEWRYFLQGVEDGKFDI